jgi:hypothetical protein
MDSALADLLHLGLLAQHDVELRDREMASTASSLATSRCSSATLRSRLSRQIASARVRVAGKADNAGCASDRKRQWCMH